MLVAGSFILVIKDTDKKMILWCLDMIQSWYIYFVQILILLASISGIILTTKTCSFVTAHIYSKNLVHVSALILNQWHRSMETKNSLPPISHILDAKYEKPDLKEVDKKQAHLLLNQKESL